VLLVSSVRCFFVGVCFFGAALVLLCTAAPFICVLLAFASVTSCVFMFFDVYVWCRLLTSLDSVLFVLDQV
jgi:hypothetical protein